MKETENAGKFLEISLTVMMLTFKVKKMTLNNE